VRKIVVFLVLILPFSSSPTAIAATLNFTLEVWSDDSVVSFEHDEIIPSQSAIKNQLLQNCRREITDIQIGSGAKAVNQSNATAGLGKVSGVTTGKVYKGFQPGWGAEEDADPVDWLNKFSEFYDFDGDNPTTVSTVFVAPCIFKGTLNNLRTSSFYRFYIGEYRTAEYDINELKKKKWRLSLSVNELACSNYFGFEDLIGCD
jgi:hypothetical protein